MAIVAMKAKAKEEFDYLRESLDSWSEDEVVNELIDRADEKMYDRPTTVQIREYAIAIGVYVEVSQDQLDAVISSGGKNRCDFRQGGAMYVWSGDLSVS